MTPLQLLNIWTPYEAANVIIWLSLIILLLYLAKNPAHKTIRSLCHMISQGLEHMAVSVLAAEKKIQERNKEVLLTEGLVAVEKNIEREFHRVNTVVERDLSGFPVLKRQLLEQIARIEDDYQQSSEIPPSPPEWVEAVESLAKLPNDSNENKAVTNILREIHKTTCSQHKGAMDEYRKAVGIHHAALNNLMPYWRKLTQTLDDVGKIITGLHGRSVKIDQHMGEYEAIRARSNRAERALSSSSMTQFFISGLALAIAIWGIIINFNLIALPMSEMVGGNSYIGSMKTSDVVALVIILVEVAIGLYLMESLMITRLFPVIRQMDDKMRVRMIWLTFFFLLTLAGVEASLALMRERIALNDEALKQILSGNEVLHPTSTLIPTLGQMVLSFILPFVLTLTAIPLETFVHASRTVLGVLTAFSMRFTAFALTLSGKIISNSGEFLISVYDLIIFPPLWFEDLLFTRFKKNTYPMPLSDNELPDAMVPNDDSDLDESDTDDEIPTFTPREVTQ
ncbi:MAG: hypothetical protein KKD44_24895 [Proteobacteria bacterium]|nr:hypothetical protein [Pseudomonadota bacterium]